LAEEIETPGPGQVRALVCMAGNLVLSGPNGNRFDRALQSLEYMVSIDFYINETSRNANIIFPPTTLFEAEHYGILEHAMGIRNTAHYVPALFPKPKGAKSNSEIMLDLVYHLEKHKGLFSHGLGWVKRKALDIFSPSLQMDLLLRFGPHKLSIKKLREHPHGIDLGPLVPRIEEILTKPKRKINLTPEILVQDLGRLRKKLESNDSLNKGEFLLISRRSINSMNSWTHNLPSLARGRTRCTLMMCQKDAGEAKLKDGQEVMVTSRVGMIRVPLEVTDEMMPGVVCLATGWGHDRKGARLSVASKNPGASMNDITDDRLFDVPSGITAFHGVPVKVSA
jgi:anaerobic selenocysteine-containing dehydrogenase